MSPSLKINAPQELSGVVLQHIVCPCDVVVASPSIFFAGGITGCSDWQSDLAAALFDQPVQAFNPRRYDFPIDDPTASDAQIRWEHNYLQKVDAVSFWFPQETVCPITLYELGKCIGKGDKMFVGADPSYPRLADLKAILSVHRPQAEISLSVAALSEQIKVWVSNHQPETKLSIPFNSDSRSIFLAGGIKGCPDWQKQLSTQISSPTLIINNPRKENFSPLGTEEYHSLISENHRRLLSSSAVSFWFPKETLNPIVLLELGIASAMTEKKLFVGVEPGYKCQIDVTIQTALSRPEVQVVSSLTKLSQQILHSVV